MLKLISTVLLCLCLSACSLTPSKTKTDHWDLSGKIGITTPSESVAGFIQWQQKGKEFDIYVSGPLSVGSARIEGNAASISLTRDGKTVEGLNPQQLIYEELGWFFPIENLPFWLKGKASPYSSAKKELNDDQQLSVIEQDAWRIDYLRYDEFYQLPQRIRISQGQWKFLIVIKHWNFS